MFELIDQWWFSFPWHTRMVWILCAFVFIVICLLVGREKGE